MKVHIRTIRPEGIELEETFPVEMIGLTENDSVRFILPVQVKANITKTEDEMIVKVTVGSRYQSLCSRCLDDVQQDWTVDFTLVFDIDNQMEFVELGEDIRQELILSLPGCILCREDCKGLCIDCGFNLNNESCQCKIKSRKDAKSYAK